MTDDRKPDFPSLYFEANKEFVDKVRLFQRSLGIDKLVVLDEVDTSRPAEPRPPERKHVDRWLVKVSGVQWADVIGAEPAKLALRDAIEAATKSPELYSFYSMKPPHGVLLYGPPGNGKTMLAKAAANALCELYGDTAGEMLLVSGPELQSKWFGETEKNIRDIFTYAREYSAHYKRPLVVFMDEADSLLTQRGGQSQFRDDIVAQFLSEMDGLKGSDAFFILASNRPDSIDEAFLRDGRIDRKIKVGRPTRADVHDILWHQLAPGADSWARHVSDLTKVVDRIYDAELNLRQLTNPSSGAIHHFNYEHIISGALVVGLVARAKLIAFQRERKDYHGQHPEGVTTADFLQAIADSFVEEKALAHHYAVQEFVETVALPAEEAAQKVKWN